MKRSRPTVEGFSLIEVLVAIAILAIVGAALVAMLPVLTTNTQASSLDTEQSQQAISVFEQIAFDWTNAGAWNNATVDSGTPIATFVTNEMGADCTADVTPQPDATNPTRKRVVITCTRTGNLPDLVLRAEFGNANE